MPEGLDEVTLVRWPDEDARRASLHETGRARLLLVDHGVPAPEVLDPLEDWIRVPADVPRTGPTSQAASPARRA